MEKIAPCVHMLTTCAFRIPYDCYGALLSTPEAVELSCVFFVGRTSLSPFVMPSHIGATMHTVPYVPLDLSSFRHFMISAYFDAPLESASVGFQIIVGWHVEIHKMEICLLKIYLMQKCVGFALWCWSWEIKCQLLRAVMLQCAAHLSFLDWHLGDVHSENMGKSLDTLKAWLDLAAWFPDVFSYLFILFILES